jgi:hypothetical protein
MRTAGTKRYSPYFLIRRSALAYAALAGLRSRRLQDVADEADRLHEELARGRDELCERLYRVIQGQSETCLRRQLLALKRSVHNGRVPDAPAAAVGVPAVREKDTTLERDLKRWIKIARACADSEAQAAAAIEADRVSLRARLRELWEHSPIALGILFSQPRLYAKLEVHFSQSGKEDRRAEAALLAYCQRAIAKTTPFSTLTQVGIGSLDGDGHADISNAFGSHRSFVTLNALLVQKLTEDALADPDIRAHLHVEPAAVMARGTSAVDILVSRSRLLSDAVGDTSEAIRSVTLSGAVAFALDGCAERPTIAALAARLADAAKVAPERAAGLIGKLVDCGLLEPKMEYDANDRRAIESLAGLLSELANPKARRAGEALKDVQSAIDRLSDAAPREAAGLLTTTRTSVASALETLGTTLPAGTEQFLVRHNSIASGLARPDAADMDGLRPALEIVASVMPLFNGDLAQRCVIQDVFLEIYGARGECSNVLELFSKMNERLRVDAYDGRREAALSAAARNNAIVREAAKLRHELLVSIPKNAEGRRIVEIPLAFWKEWGARAGCLPTGNAPPSVAFFGQFARTGAADVLFVVNKVRPGYGTIFATYASDGGTASQIWLTETLRRHLPGIAPGADMAELVATLGFDGQIRPRLTPMHLAYPGEPRSRDDRHAISWNDLAVQSQADSGGGLVLRRKSTDRIVIPLHLGTLAEAHLPPFYRFIKSFGPAFAPDWPLIDYFEALVPGEAREVRRYPRLMTGNLVLLRETWCVPSELVPVQATGATQFGNFRTLRAWARELGFPKRVFVTPMRTQDYFQSTLPGQSFRRAHKPFYVDWDDLASHQLFHRYTALGRAILTISEALPDPCDESNAADHNLEYVVELNG